MVPVTDERESLFAGERITDYEAAFNETLLERDSLQERVDHLLMVAQEKRNQRDDCIAACTLLREERASLLRELATIFGPAPARKGATDNERWLHHIGHCLTVAGVEFTESGE